MASKIPFLIGLGAGYVLGTRAGRAQYERIKATASRVAEQPFVREKVDAATSRASSFVRQQGEVVTDKVADAVKETLFGGRTRDEGQTETPDPIRVDEAQVRSV